MATVSDFDTEGITMLYAADHTIHMDYFGQGIIINIEESTPPHARRPYRSLRGTLAAAAREYHRYTFVQPDREAARQARKTIRRALAPLLHACVPPGLAPDRNDRGRLNLAWCIYDGAQAWELAQDVEGDVYLAESLLVEEPTPVGCRAPHAIAMHLELPTYRSDQVAVEVSALSLATVAGTATLPGSGQEATCFALRDISAANLRSETGTAASMAATLNALKDITHVRARLSRDRRRELRVPALLGYIFHREPRAGGLVSRYVVGGVLPLLDGGRSWADLLRSRRPPKRERQQRWARRIRDTLAVLHEHGLAWGGAASVDVGQRVHLLMESVDVDADRRPWLVRNFAQAATGIMESDVAAVGEMLAMVGLG